MLYRRKRHILLPILLSVVFMGTGAACDDHRKPRPHDPVDRPSVVQNAAGL